MTGGGGLSPEVAGFCLDKNVTYYNRVDNPDQWTWCSVPDGGFDAVFFAGMAIVVMCVASPRWDALISLVAGGIYQFLAWEYNLGHVSNAVNLWLSMRPADIFVFIFLPPFLMDVAVRIDYFMLKKMIVNVLLMAFVMVITTCLVLIPFMLYALDLKSSGWDGGYVALFGAAIASTDAAAVVAALTAGGAPETLSVLLEGESLFNDASSLTLFEIFKEVVMHHESKGLAADLGDIAYMTVKTALIGIAVGIAIGIFNKWLFVWLQKRNMPPSIEVAFTVGGAYLSFYITQVWCKGSGCVGTVAYGLYGSATLLWGMSSKTRQSGIFQHFWSVMIFLVNALIFFFVGASCVNFTIRSSNKLYEESGAKELLSVTLYKLPFIYLYVFGVRAVFLLVTFQLLRLCKVGGALNWRECLFLAFGGLRGSLSLVLAQTMATLASTDGDTSKANRVKSEAAMYTAGFVIMTLIINAPLSVPVMTLLKLNTIGKEQLQMRSTVKHMFYRFTDSALEELQADAEEDELLQGVDWSKVKADTNFQETLDKHMPEEQPRVNWQCILYPNWARKTVNFFRSCCVKTPQLSRISSLSVTDTEDPEFEPDTKSYVPKLAGKQDLARVTVWRGGAFDLPQTRWHPQEHDSKFVIIKVDPPRSASVPTPAPGAFAATPTLPRSITRSKSSKLTAQPGMYNPRSQANGNGVDSGDARANGSSKGFGSLGKTSMASKFLGRMSQSAHQLPQLAASKSQGGGLAAVRNKSGTNSRDPSHRFAKGAAPSPGFSGPTDEDFAKAMAKASVPALSKDSSTISAPLDVPDTSKIEIQLASTSTPSEANGAPLPSPGSEPPPEHKHSGPLIMPARAMSKGSSRLGRMTPAASVNALPDLAEHGEHSDSSPRVQSRTGSVTMGGQSPVTTSPQRAMSADKHFFEEKESFSAYSYNSLVVITPGRKGTAGPQGSTDGRLPSLNISTRPSAAPAANPMLQEAMCEQVRAESVMTIGKDDRVVQRVAADGSLGTVSMQVRPLGRDRANLARSSATNMQPAYSGGEPSLSRQSCGPFGSAIHSEYTTTSLGRSSTGYNYTTTPKRGQEEGGLYTTFENEVADVHEELPQIVGDAGDTGKLPRLGRMSMRNPNLSRASKFLVQESEKLGGPSTHGGELSKHASFAESRSPFEAPHFTVPNGEHERMLTECRLRLLTGLEQHFKSKYNEGILSGPSYKTLAYVTSKSHEEPWRPVRLWELTEKEVSTGSLLRAEAHVYYRLKAWSNKAKASQSFWQRHIVTRLLALPIWLLSWHLSSVQLAGLETAVQLWISLTDSLQTQWLMFAGQYGAIIIEEVNNNADAAWKYIVDRRIETPEKFQAVQTYRACVMLLSHQLTFVHELSHGGMIDEKEAHRMEDAMQRKLQEVCRAGPQWRPQKIGEILGSVPFVRNIDPVYRSDIAKFLRKSANIYVYKEGECIWEHWSNQQRPPGMFIVLRGVVEMRMQAGDRQQSVYLGTGGMGGLLGLVLNDVIPGVGFRAAYASGTALGKGPSVLYLRREVFEHIQMLSREQRLPMFQHLELSIFRTAAGLVMDLLKGQIMSQLGVFVCSAIAACLTSQKWDSRVAKRQHIRAIFSDALEGEAVEGAINPIHVDWVTELLNVPKDVALALLDGRLDKEVATAPWHKAMFQAIAVATKSVYEMIRGCVRESWLVHLRPGQTIWQTSTMLLMQGSLKAGTVPDVSALNSNSFRHAAAAHDDALGTTTVPGENGTMMHVIAADLGHVPPEELHLPGAGIHVPGNGLHPLAPRVSNQGLGTLHATPNDLHEAPSVMVWTADYFTAEVPSQPPIAITAGSKGASLLIWGVDSASLFSGDSGYQQV